MVGQARRGGLAAAIVLVGAAAAAGADGPTLTLDRIFASGDFDEHLPADVLWLPRGDAFVYRHRSGETDGLWRHDVGSGQVRLLADMDTVAKTLAAARPGYSAPPLDNVNSHSGAGRGPQLSPDGRLYLDAANGDLCLIELAGGHPRYLTSAPGDERFAAFSPDGTRIAFARDGDLYRVDLNSGRELRLTDRGDRADLLNGEADWVYEEELDVSRSFWWSPKGDRILFAQYDTSPVSVIPIPDDLELIPTIERQRYPKAGGANSAVRLGVIGSGGGPVNWLFDAEPSDAYLVRAGWLPDGSAAWYEVLNRDQTRLELRVARPGGGGFETVLSEQDDAWVNVFEGPTFIDSQRFLWTSERDGFRHLYLYRRDGTLLQQLTLGEWQVDEVLGVGAGGERVFFSANTEDARERHVYSVGLDGTGLRRLVTGNGTHEARLAPGGGHFLDTFSSLTTPPRMDLYDGDGVKRRTIDEGAIPALDSVGLRAPALGSLPAEDGTPLFWSMLRPPSFDASRRYPVLVYVYGGPGTQLVTNDWQGKRGLFYELLARKGLIVFTLDNRGSGGRGHRFEKAVFRRLGQIELADQVAGAQYLKTLPCVDPERIGIYGGSYGGYMTLMCMNKAAEHFRVGVAYAPVTDWRLYDSVYAERYMDRPQDNPDGYREGAPLHFAGGMTGKLLICHGAADNNVHVQQTLQMAEQYIKAGKLFELMLYPRVRHGIRVSRHRLHFHALKTDFLERHLIQGGPK